MNSPIASIDTFRANYPVHGAFKFFDRRSTTRGRETVVVRVRDEAGRCGWGQCVPSHRWSYETIESVQTTLDQYLGPALIGLDPFDDEAIAATLRTTIAPGFSTGQPICKAGIDLALFDLTGKIRHQTAHQRWGREGRRQITLSWTLDVRDVSEVEPTIEAAWVRGFRNFNLKVGTDPSLDVMVCREIRRLVPDAFLWVDANGGYDLEGAMAVARPFAECGVAALEQPFPANRLSWFGRLRQQQALPILMDEGVVSLVDLIEFHQLGLLDGVAMKVARCGGLTEALRIACYLENNGLLLYASGLTDPDISLAASLLLFSACDLRRPAALNAPQFLDGSILQSPLIVRGDQALVPDGPGLGVTVDEELCHARDFLPSKENRTSHPTSTLPSG